MKNKLLITIVSVVLNLALFSALAYFDKINGRADGATAPLFRVQHLNEASLAQSDSHEIASSSIVK